MSKGIEVHLKKACQLTGGDWAVLASCEKGHWYIDAAHGLSNSSWQHLADYLADGAVAAWLDKARQRTGGASARLPRSAALGAARLYVYPLQQETDVLLVASGPQQAAARRLWKLVSELLSDIADEASRGEVLPSMQTELAYDMPRALESLLVVFARASHPHGAWLGIRRGDTFDVEAQWNESKLAGSTFTFDSSRPLRRVYRTRAEIIVRSDEMDWANLPHPVRKSSVYWACFPLMVGQRLIGALATWGPRELQHAEFRTLRQLARQFSQPVEVIITLSELTTHLRRLAMLNDFALSVTAAQSLDQIARRVLGHMARTFPAESAQLYLPSIDARSMREYHSVEGKFSSLSLPLPGHRMLPFLKGRAVRQSDYTGELKPAYVGARSGLMVPLKFRGGAIGILWLESTRPAAFSQYDEHLLGVIASHLAGLIEYGRVHEEAEARARNLGLIHEVVQQVITLTDRQQIAQVTADLLSQYFAYESAGVVLSPDGGPVVAGFAGSETTSMQSSSMDGKRLLEAGAAALAFSTGQSVLVSDNSDTRLVPGVSPWDGGSELCVPLKQGGNILGVIDARSRRPNAFTSNDQVAMESLAGVLSAVLTSANQYERLEETVHQLRDAQVEVRSRLAAQQEAESRLLQAAKLVAVGEMAAGIAHELNNPLTTVTGFAELILEETPPDAAIRADVEMVLQEALRARSVVRRLLDFARQGEQARNRADVNEILNDVLALTKHFIHTSGVQLELDFEKDLPWVLVDTNQIKQVFINLLHNALHAMPTGGHLQLGTRTAHRDDRKWVVAKITDTGIGISREDMDRIFEPFFTTRSSRGGTGLGLSVSYGIVTDHGGTIDVASQPGEGSTFSVWLPT